MGSQYVDEGNYHRKFFHPYMQSFTMFVGEACCLVLYFVGRKKHELPLEEGKQPHKFYCFFVPALSDAISSVLQYMALNFISGSTYLMFKGASIVTTAIFSMLLFGMVIEKRHLIGCGAAIAGLVVVGASGFLESADASSSVGVGLCRTTSSWGTV
jgi:drug/metabolite transporter (DMT)-like permease